jgi:DNA polymerase-3 subunit epsilon
MYTIIDIETTGGSADRDRITEIAIYKHNGIEVVDEFTTLVNPETHIPYYITQMTGISNEMVENAPRFFEVAKRIVEITEGTFFVAHNAQFDYRFVEAEFKRLGYSYSRKTLCTVKLSRKLIPGYPSYSLGNICSDLGIKIDSRHRASGDAKATVKLFELLLKENPDLAITAGVSKKSLADLHPQLTPDKIERIPENTGIYYFFDEKDSLLYVGKSVNIRSRVLQHLAETKTKRAVEMRSRIAAIDFELTGSELIALLLELEQIKSQIPIFNRLSRRATNSYGLFVETDSAGYLNITIEKINSKNCEPLASFPLLDDARSTLNRLVDQFTLCQKLCGLYKSDGSCFHHQIRKCRGACVGAESAYSYNIRAERACKSLLHISGSFILLDRGRQADEKSFIKVSNGKVIGYGYFDPTFDVSNAELLTDSMIPLKNYKETAALVGSFLVKAKAGQVIFLNSD